MKWNLEIQTIQFLIFVLKFEIWQSNNCVYVSRVFYIQLARFYSLVHRYCHQEEGVVEWVWLPVPEIFLGWLATMALVRWLSLAALLGAPIEQRKKVSRGFQKSL